MADVVFNSFKQYIMDGTIDLDTDTIKVALMTNAFTPNIDTHHFWSDVSANEASGSGYTAGGQALTTKAVATDDTNDRGTFDADDPSWASTTITARYAIIYKDTGVAATSPLIGCWDFGSDQSSSNGTFTINVNSVGILALT